MSSPKLKYVKSTKTWTFGKYKGLTYDEAIQKQIRYDLLLQQCFNGEKPSIY